MIGRPAVADHHGGACEKCRLSGSTLDPLNEHLPFDPRVIRMYIKDEKRWPHSCYRTWRGGLSLLPWSWKHRCYKKPVCERAGHAVDANPTPAC